MIYNNFDQRELGSTIIAYNFEVLMASPLDPRTVVKSSHKLYDVSAWFINKTVPTYLYPGLVVTDISQGNPTLKQYVYKGEPFVADSNNPDNPKLEGTWQCITFTNNPEQVTYPLKWNTNPRDASINLNQYALYLGDSSNGEILLSNDSTYTQSVFRMNSDGISLLYNNDYSISINQTGGINIQQREKGNIKLKDNVIYTTANAIDIDSSSFVLDNSDDISINTKTMHTEANNYDVSSKNSTIDISNLILKNSSLNINSSILNITSKDFTNKSIKHKIYASNYTVFHANTADISNNELDSAKASPCIQIINDTSYNTPALILSNYSNIPAYLQFYNEGNINMHAINNIKVDSSEGSITLNNDAGSINLDSSTNIANIYSKNLISLKAADNKVQVSNTSISLISDNIQLWNNQYTLPVPDRDKVELLRFNKDKLEWTDSALLKTATIDRVESELTKPAAIRIAQAIYTYKTGNTHELWKPSITFAVNTEEGSGIFNAQVLPVVTSPDKVDYKLNIQCINNRNMFNTADNIPYVTGRIYYMNNDQYTDHPYNNPNSAVICEIYVVTSYNTANWAFLSYTQDGEIKKDNNIRNIWKLTESITKTNGDNTISIPSGIETGVTWDVTKKMYTQYEVLPHIVKSINFTSVGTTRYSFNEIPYPEKPDLGKFLQVDANNNFVWQEAAMKTYNAEDKNYVIGSLDPAQGKTLIKGTYQEQVYFTNTGDMYARNYYATSDINKKTDITDISNNNNIHAVAFKWKDTSIQSYGFIAQELEKAYPELINTDEDGSKTVNYIAALSLYTAQLEQRIAKLEKIIESKL